MHLYCFHRNGAADYIIIIISVSTGISKCVLELSDVCEQNINQTSAMILKRRLLLPINVGGGGGL